MAGRIEPGGISPENLQKVRRVLVVDPLPEAPFKELLGDGYQVDFKPGLTYDGLKEVVGEYDALVVSETAVGADLLSNPGKLSLIVRAGRRVDNIDAEAATTKGIIVANTPDVNTYSATEHTIGLISNVTRNIPQACASLKEGEWKRAEFGGRELTGKTLGVIGFGRVGEEVAKKAMAGLGMRVVAFDPYISAEKAEKLGVTLVSSLDLLLAESNVITVHVPLNDETKNLIDREAFAKMKKDDVVIINTSRGGIVNEKDILDAINSGKLAGAAFDLPKEELGSELRAHDKIICTPHLGTLTEETRDRLVQDVAEIITKKFRGETVQSAINMPIISTEAMRELAPYAELASRIASLALMISPDKGIKEVRIDFIGNVAEFDSRPLKTAVVGGLLAPISEEPVNLVNYAAVAKQRGIIVREYKNPNKNDYASLIRVRLESEQGETTIEGFVGHDGPRVVGINGYKIDVPLNGQSKILLVENRNVRGMVGKVGTLLGELANIDQMYLARPELSENALMFMLLDDPLKEEDILQIKTIDGVVNAQFVTLPK